MKNRYRVIQRRLAPHEYYVQSRFLNIFWLDIYGSNSIEWAIKFCKESEESRDEPIEKVIYPIE